MAAERMLTLCHQCVDETRTSPARPISSWPPPPPSIRAYGAQDHDLPELPGYCQQPEDATPRPREREGPVPTLHQFRQKICQRGGLLNVFIWVSTDAHFNKIARACNTAPHKLYFKV